MMMMKIADRGLWNVEDLKSPNAIGSNVHFRSDSVAKVVLQKVSKILRAPGAVFV
jgi:hypothetical protein